MNYNAWLVTLAPELPINRLQVSLPNTMRRLDSVTEGDIFVFIDNGKIKSFARVFRIRENIKECEFYFDGFIDAIHRLDTAQFGVTQASETPITRLAFNSCEKMLEAARLIPIKDFPLFQGEKPDEQAHIRNLLRLALIDGLLGPANGPYEEILEMSVRDRYLVGKLAPIVIDGRLRTDSPFSEDASQDKNENVDLVELANKDHIPFDENSKSADFDDDEEKDIDEFMIKAGGYWYTIGVRKNSYQLSVRWGKY